MVLLRFRFPKWHQSRSSLIFRAALERQFSAAPSFAYKNGLEQLHSCSSTALELQGVAAQGLFSLGCGHSAVNWPLGIIMQPLLSETGYSCLLSVPLTLLINNDHWLKMPGTVSIKQGLD